MYFFLIFINNQVSPYVDDGGRNEHVICVYTPNYQDTSQVMHVENPMRSTGQAGDFLYKPDIFSTLGINRSNKWGFRASIYTSKVMLQEGRSRITSFGSETCHNVKPFVTTGLALYSKK